MSQQEAEIVKIIATILAVAVAVIGHEIMHGWVAYKYGDNTAKSQGRLSINPIVHVDPVGTILIPAILYFTNASFLFGWAKPVPVNIATVVRNGGYNAAIAVALAGVTFNLFLATFFATLLPAFSNPDNIFSGFLVYFVAQSILINVVLAVFNLWPIPPLDGSQALLYLTQKFKWYKFSEIYEKVYPFGTIILFGILFIPQLSQILFRPASWILDLIL